MPDSAENPPFFSIVIPTFNRANRVLGAIQSILNQTFTNFEVIVVDDGSTDDTRDCVAKVVSSDPRIKYYYKQNEERSIARNYGIVHAAGRYINFLDSDDIAYANHLQVAYELLKNNSFPEIGHLGYQFIDAARNPILIRNDFDESFKKKLIYENFIHGNAIFIRQDIANQIKFIPSKSAILSEDWYVWLRLAARYKFYFDNTVTSAVVQHDERSLAKIDPDRLIASTNIVVEYLKKDSTFLSAYNGFTSYHFANHYTFLTLILALTKRRRLETLKFLFTAIRYDPFVIVRRRFLASIKHLI